ncbi:MAG TPA: aspartate aminotransferase family protein [Candidatus Baltobacteraceae bacterium]|jgi:4-aminobutyrate aminotransferase-like enzyme|nr:aspartate aminotransferase family protein [Candidatus Baltobacteraceae bacterium]
MSEELERIVTAIPGPRTAELMPALRAYESRNVTYVGDGFPVFWESASGSTITDSDGNRYIDLTAAFGVANAGHANPYVVSAIADQAARLMHGMGDVHPHEARTRLLERLAGILPKGLTKTFLATTGSEAVEAALKTAMLATGKSHFIAYRNAYHGLSLGVLPLSGIEKFRTPFARAIGPSAILLEYPQNVAGANVAAAIATAREAIEANGDVAALVIEPIQGRGGCIVPPPGYLAALRELCSELGVVMIVDEIYTGFGRTGTWFAVEHDRVVPDIICIGKAMGSGFPISACAGRAGVMDAWPLSSGEALHTSTYLGNPMGCAAALATIREIERLALPAKARQAGLALSSRLDALRAGKNVVDVRGRGLFWGIQFRDAEIADRVVKRALVSGVIVLQSGSDGATVTVAPPLVITDRQLGRGIELLEAAIRSSEYVS